MEHLRDIPNALAYNIGAFHFYSKSSWAQIFQEAGLTSIDEQKHSSFISLFRLTKG